MKTSLIKCSASNRWPGDGRSDRAQLNRGRFQPGGNSRGWERKRCVTLGGVCGGAGGVEAGQVILINFWPRAGLCTVPDSLCCQQPEHEQGTEQLFSPSWGCAAEAQPQNRRLPGKSSWQPALASERHSSSITVLGRTAARSGPAPRCRS